MPKPRLPNSLTTPSTNPPQLRGASNLHYRVPLLCIGFARPLVLAPRVNSSIIVGFRVGSDLKETIRFLEDPAIPTAIIHETCERCPLTAEQCQVRPAEPTLLQIRERTKERRLALNELTTELGKEMEETSKVPTHPG